MAKDPVCGMMVDEEKAAARSEYKGVTCPFPREGVPRHLLQPRFAKSRRGFLVTPASV